MGRRRKSAFVPTTDYFGWRDDPAAVEKVLNTLDHPLANLCMGPGVKDSGKGQVALLYRYVQACNGGKYTNRVQTAPDCGGNAAAGACDVLMAVRAAVQGAPEHFQAPAAVEPIYGGARVEVAGQRAGKGVVMAWVAKWLETYGVLLMQRYGKHDLSRYSGDRSNDWGRNGVPNELEPIAREHPVLTTSLVRDYETARDLLVNGCPLVIGSMQGFREQRDAEGFAKPSGRWPHAMMIHAVDDEYRRPGLCVQNSWPKGWISGPTRHDQPWGSFWVDADFCNRWFRDAEVWAMSSMIGFKRQRLAHTLI
jgi:hypothetical protein